MPTFNSWRARQHGQRFKANDYADVKTEYQLQAASGDSDSAHVDVQLASNPVSKETGFDQINKQREKDRQGKTLEERQTYALELIADTLETLRIEALGISHALGNLLRNR